MELGAQAYDRLEWSFILQILYGFGFSSLWIQLISQCISTVSYSLLLNGSPFGCIIPSRGLRQGDPLSPFLFILATEDLSRLILRVKRLGLIHSIQAARGAPFASHLLFADDLVIFCRANMREARAMDDILVTYCGWSGQLVNKVKSSIYFSPNSLPEVTSTISNFLNLKLMKKGSKYLGLPLFWGKDKSKHFAEIKERIQSKVSGWKSKILSQSGKTILIKSVATSLPQYYMQSLHFPIGWCYQVDKILKRLLVGSSGA